MNAEAARTEQLLHEVRQLLNEVDCRIQHGAESGGHLEYVHGRLSLIAARYTEWS